MPTLPVQAYDRPGIAASNLLSGDPLAAGTALVAPEELAPGKLKSLKDRMMEQLGGFDNPFLRGIMSIATDPLVIISLFLSSKYPVVSAKKLFEVGRKYAGYAHKIGPIEGLIGRADRFFANTPIPDLLLHQTARKTAYDRKWFGMLQDYFDDFKKKTGHAPTAQEMAEIGAKLDKLDTKPLSLAGGTTSAPIVANKIKLTSAQQSLHDKLKQQFFPKFYKEVIEPQQHMKGGPLADALRRGGIAEIDDYLPHTLIRTPSAEAEYALSLQIQSGFSDKNLGKILSSIIERQSPVGHAKQRLRVLAPSVNELKSYGFKLNSTAVTEMDDLISRMSTNATTRVMQDAADILRQKGPVVDKVNALKQVMNKRGIPLRGRTQAFDVISEAISKDQTNTALEGIRQLARQGSMRREYSIQAASVLDNYVHSGASPYIWSVEKITPELAKTWNLSKNASLGQAINTAKNRLVQPGSVAIFEQDYLPMMRGHLTETQVSSMLRWSNAKLKTLESLDSGILKKWVPDSISTKLKDMLLAKRGPLSYLNVNAKLASYFYYSALGFNPSSAIQNLSQPLITTMPAVGPKAFWSGLKNTMHKASSYFDARGRGLDPEKALTKAFPEFAESGMATAPLSRGILDETLESVWAQASDVPGKFLSKSAGGAMDQLKRAAMFMFSSSERFNRLVTYESGLAKAAADGLGGGKALDFASKLVRATQFPAGPGQMPRALLKLSAPWRQFMYFPMRYLGFLMESTMYGGQNTRNWGTLARAAGYSAITKNVASEMLGVDVSRSLMTGAMPLPEYENAPFFPLPIMPPIAGIIGAGVESVATQSTAPLKQSAAIMMPAGVQARRLWKTFSPKYAKYDERTEDGRIPVYGEKGGLIRYATPWQLALQGIGLQPTDKVEESETVGYLIRHRDKIRDIRRQYVEAIVNGDPEEAQRINASFERQYGMGPLELKESDLRAAKERRTTSRVQRILKTMPKAYRPMFEEALNTSYSAQMADAFPTFSPSPISADSLPGFQFGTGAGGFTAPGISAGSSFGAP